MSGLYWGFTVRERWRKRWLSRASEVLREQGKDQVIQIDTTQYLKRADQRLYFKCPWCDSDDHCASISLEVDSLSFRPIHCYETGKMGWVDMRRGDEIKSVLSAEEAKMSKLLAKFKGWLDETPDDSVSPQECFRLWNERGLPFEIAEEKCSDVKRLYELKDCHSETSRAKGKTVWV